MKNNNVSPEQIDALLPQTQCGQCEYAGCQPYAEAIIKQGETINRCKPGGVKTLLALAEILQQDPKPYLAEVAAQEPPILLASIREAECIGCTKCIQACPVDAIIGAAKQMHTVLSAECTGCTLCVEPCPVDCIEMQPVANLQYSPQKARKRYTVRAARLAMEQDQHSLKRQQARLAGQAQAMESPVEAKKRFIQEAVARAKAKKQ